MTKMHNDPVRDHIAHINAQHKAGIIDNETRHRLVRSVLNAAKFGGLKTL